MPTPPRLPVTGWRLTLAASTLSFCMYAFRKPLAAGTYGTSVLYGLDLKTMFLIGQVLGCAASKYIGIRLVSEASRASRPRWIVRLVVASEVALLAFAVLPPRARVVALFFNGLPLGMIWGLTVRYLEGRRSTEFLLSALSCSFIVSSGAVKDVGRWLMGLGVPEYFMPAATGALFLVPLMLSVHFLDRIPEPTAQDAASREPRPPMRGQDRRTFMLRYLPGLALLLLCYLGLTGFRDFRDNYGVELFSELGYGNETGLFTRTEFPVALVVMLTLGATSVFQTRMQGLVAVFTVMIGGVVLLGLSTLAFDGGLLSGQAWMICMGLGAFLAYVPFSSFLFDRIMAATRFAGTAVFAVNLADAVGYSGSVGVQLFKDLAVRSTTRLEFFRVSSYVLSVSATALLSLAAVYFVLQSRAANQGGVPERD